MCTVRHRNWQQPSWALQVCQAAGHNVCCPPCSPAGVPEQSCLGDCSWDLQETHSCPVCKMRAPQLSQRDVWGSRDSFFRLLPPHAAHACLPFLLLSLSAAPLCRWRRWQTQHPSSPPVTTEPVGGGGLYGAFIMPYGDVSPRSGVMIQDMGENLQNSRSFSPTYRFLPPPTVGLQRWPRALEASGFP